MVASGFLNAKKRVIHEGSRGGFYVNVGGKKVYGPKAKFRANGSKITGKAHANVPSPIRRATRKNAGVARKHVIPTRMAFQRFFATNANAKKFVSEMRKVARKAAPNAKKFPIKSYNRAGVVVIGRNGNQWRVQRVYSTLNVGPKFYRVWKRKSFGNGY